MARASSAGIRTSYYISLCYGSSSSSSSFVIPKKSSQLCMLLLARARARQMASGGFAISISGTKNRSESMESFVSKICMYFPIDRIIRLLTFGDFSQQAAVATVLSLIEYGI